MQTDLKGRGSAQEPNLGAQGQDLLNRCTSAPTLAPARVETLGGLSVVTMPPSTSTRSPRAAPLGFGQTRSAPSFSPRRGA